MKDYRNPTCNRLCGADEMIVNAKRQADVVQRKAVEAGCLSVNGHFSCDGPAIVISTNTESTQLNWGVSCRATWTTPEIMHAGDAQIADAFDQQVQQIMNDMFKVT
jgi:hypothetical protein